MFSARNNSVLAVLVTAVLLVGFIVGVGYVIETFALAARTPVHTQESGLNFKAMSDACFVETNPRLCQTQIEEMVQTRNYLVSWSKMTKYDEYAPGFVSHFRIKLNEEQKWFSERFPKAWEMR